MYMLYVYCYVAVAIQLHPFISVNLWNLWRIFWIIIWLTFPPSFQIKKCTDISAAQGTVLYNPSQCILPLMNTGCFQTSFAFILQYTFPDHGSPPPFPWRKGSLGHQRKLNDIFLYLCLPPSCSCIAACMEWHWRYGSSCAAQGEKARRSCCRPSDWSLVHSISREIQKVKIFLSCLVARYLGATLHRWLS